MKESEIITKDGDCLDWLANDVEVIFNAFLFVQFYSVFWTIKRVKIVN